MTDGSEKRNCEVGFSTPEFSCYWKAQERLNTCILTLRCGFHACDVYAISKIYAQETYTQAEKKGYMKK